MLQSVSGRDPGSQASKGSVFCCGGTEVRPAPRGNVDQLGGTPLKVCLVVEQTDLHISAQSGTQLEVCHVVEQTDLDVSAQSGEGSAKSGVADSGNRIKVLQGIQERAIRASNDLEQIQKSHEDFMRKYGHKGS